MDDEERIESRDAKNDVDCNRLPESLPIADSIPNEHACSYLEGRVANLPLKLPARPIRLDEFDAILASGFRRSGVFLYNTACQKCSACEPSRVDVGKFVWKESFLRVLKRGNRSVEIRVDLPSIDSDRLALFNRHRLVRGLGEMDQEYQSNEYESFLVDSCCAETLEISFWSERTLIAVSIVDCGLNSLSAVYTYFEPAFSRLSLGTYSILKQFEFAQKTDRQYVYLGMYVAENHHLSYKSRFVPQERWIGGRWLPFGL